MVSEHTHTILRSTKLNQSLRYCWTYTTSPLAFSPGTSLAAASATKQAERQPAWPVHVLRKRKSCAVAENNAIFLLSCQRPEGVVRTGRVWEQTALAISRRVCSMIGSRPSAPFPHGHLRWNQQSEKLEAARAAAYDC